MNRTVLGAVGALLLAAVGLFWWQGRAATRAPAPPPGLLATGTGEAPDAIPTEDGDGLMGEGLPQASGATREERRFNRFDRNRDNTVSRNEILAPRVKAFRKLDTDHNNLLSFEEWSAVTSNRFRKADTNGDGVLTRAEFASTRQPPVRHPACTCRGGRSARP